MIDELFAKFEGSFAGNTIRAYRADFNRFSQWCVERNVNSLGTIFRLSDRHDPSKSPAVVLALKRMYRQKRRAQKQAIPLTFEVLVKLPSVW